VGYRDPLPGGRRALLGRRRRGLLCSLATPVSAVGAGEKDSLSKEQEKVTGGRSDKGKQMRRKACWCVAVDPLRLAGKDRPC
jgi:hypothetical protein